MKNNILKIRKEKRLSQKGLAERAGTTYQQIGKLEKGERKLSPEWQIRLSKALNCRPVDLMPEQQDALCALGVSMAQPVKKDEAG